MTKYQRWDLCQCSCGCDADLEPAEDGEFYQVAEVELPLQRESALQDEISRLKDTILVLGLQLEELCR